MGPLVVVQDSWDLIHLLLYRLSMRSHGPTAMGHREVLVVTTMMAILLVGGVRRSLMLLLVRLGMMAGMGLVLDGRDCLVGLLLGGGRAYLEVQGRSGRRRARVIKDLTMLCFWDQAC